jgi:hypothetical protein
MCSFVPPLSVTCGHKTLRPEQVIDTIVGDAVEPVDPEAPDPKWARLLMEKYGIQMPMAPETDPPRCSLATAAAMAEAQKVLDDAPVPDTDREWLA